MRLAYETVTALVYDPVAANRNTTRASLRALGFRQIDTVSTPEDLESALRQRPPDLVLCEAHGSDGPLCALIQKLRRGGEGFNPFVVIIVTAWTNDQALIKRIVNSGADDLLLRPFSTSLLESRIRAHTERRKNFVVTSDYVGPDRRPEKREPNVELFEPPNSLRMKAKERLSPDQVSQRLDDELKAACAALTAEKLKRDAFQICILWRLLQEHKPGTETFASDLGKLRTLALDVRQRCAAAGYDAAVESCESAMAAVEGLEAGIDRNASMHLLGQSALHLKQYFEPDKTDAQHMGELDATMDMIHAREAEKLAS